MLFSRFVQAGVAQLVEQLICNQQVAGSSPIASSRNVDVLYRSGEVPERSKGADCKSVGGRLRWFESTPRHQFCDRPLAGALNPGGTVVRQPFGPSGQSRAGVAQLAEHQPSKLRVAGSTPVSRSTPSLAGRPYRGAERGYRTGGCPAGAPFVQEAAAGRVERLWLHGSTTSGMGYARVSCWTGLERPT